MLIGEFPRLPLFVGLLSIANFFELTMSAPLPKVFVQDLPPKGGYPMATYEFLPVGDFDSLKRNLPIRVSGATMWLIGTVTVGLGLWRMMYGIRKEK